MIEFRGNQLYFLGNGRITLYKDSNRILDYEEKWLSQIESKITTDGRESSLVIHNYSRSVQLHGNYAYYIGTKGNLCRLDLPTLIRTAETRRSYRAENLQTGSIVNFSVAGKDQVLSLAEHGVITVVECSRAVKQTGRIAEGESFTCISHVDDNILIASYSPNEMLNKFRLLGPDLRDLPPEQQIEGACRFR